MHVGLLGFKLVGVRVKTGGCGVQLHVTATGFAFLDPEKVNVPFWQGMDEMVTVTDLPGDNLPLAGLKVTPLRLLLAVHLTVPVELDDSDRVTVHWLWETQLGLVGSKLVGVTIRTGGGGLLAAITGPPPKTSDAPKTIKQARLVIIHLGAAYNERYWRCGRVPGQECARLHDSEPQCVQGCIGTSFK